MFATPFYSWCFQPAYTKKNKAMWPSGKVQVCKTFYGGSIPPLASLYSFGLYGKQSKTGWYFYTTPFFFIC